MLLIFFYKHIWTILHKLALFYFYFKLKITLNVCGTIISPRSYSCLHVHLMDQPYHMEKSVGDYLHQNRSKALSLTEPRLDTQSITEATIESTSTGHTPSSTSFPSASTNFTSESEGSPYLVGPPKHFTQHPHSAQNVVDQNWSYLGSSRLVESPIPIPKEIQPRASASENPTQATLNFSRGEMRLVIHTIPKAHYSLFN